MGTKRSREKVPRGGIGYGALRGIYGRDSAPLPNAAFNFLGRFASPQRDSFADSRWHLDLSLCGIDKAPEDRIRDGSVVDVTAWMEGGCLVVDFDTFLTEAAHRRLVNSFESELRRIFAALVASAEAFSRRTVERRSAAVSMPSFEPFITLNDNLPGKKLFILPPGEGGAESYLNNIAKQIKNIPLVLFNNIQLHSPMNSFEEIARYYLPFVRRIQPSGPYSLLGWSFGGVLALEMSRQLACAGELIGELMMIDPYFDATTMAAEANLPVDPALLDVINFRYKPEPSTLATLLSQTHQTLIFKATATCERQRSDLHKAMSRYYVDSRCNNLDRLLPWGNFTVLPLVGASHYTWVHDNDIVADLAKTICHTISGRVLSSADNNDDMPEDRSASAPAQLGKPNELIYQV